MIQWITFVIGIAGVSIFVYLLTKHLKKDIYNDVAAEQAADYYSRLAKVRKAEKKTNDKFDKRQEYLLKSNIIDWPDSGVIELPKEINNKPKRSRKRKL